MKKRFFECWEADLLSVSTLSDLMLLVVGGRKRAVHKECLSWESNVGHCAPSCRPHDGNKPFSKKT